MKKRSPNGRFCSAEHEIFHKGYKVIYQPSHPHARANGYVYEHILVAERKIGRQLTGTEVVHHIDRNKLNNSPENLMVFPNQSEHDRFHWKERGRVYKLSDGRVMTMEELTEMSGIPATALYQRIKKLGWTVDEAITGEYGKRRSI